MFFAFGILLLCLFFVDSRAALQSFRSYIDTVRPSERSALNEEFPEKPRVFKRFKNGPFEPLRNIYVLLSSIIETS